MPYFVKRNEKVSGPFTGTQIKSAAKSGKLKETDLISGSKDGPWKALAQALGSKVASDIPQAVTEESDLGGNDVAAWLDEGEDGDGNAADSSNQSVMDTGAPPLPTSVGSRNETDDPVALSKNQSTSSKPTKDCPYCAEPIAIAAIKCKHCGEMLEGNFTPPNASQQPRELEVRQESDFVLSVRGPYEQVFDLAKRSLLACEGKLKKDSIAEGYLVGGWKYGINPFGLSVSLELENASGGWIRITAKGFFSDSFDTLGHAKKKSKTRRPVAKATRIRVNNHEFVRNPTDQCPSVHGSDGTIVKSSRIKWSCNSQFDLRTSRTVAFWSVVGPNRNHSGHSFRLTGRPSHRQSVGRDYPRNRRLSYWLFPDVDDDESLANNDDRSRNSNAVLLLQS